jgi:hypothetical protein
VKCRVRWPFVITAVVVVYITGCQVLTRSLSPVSYMQSLQSFGIVFDPLMIGVAALFSMWGIDAGVRGALSVIRRRALRKALMMPLDRQNQA